MEIAGSKEACTGCFACMQLCPKQAINVSEDENGFTQEYMNWYAQRIVLERRYDFAKAQYELALKKVIEQS